MFSTSFQALNKEAQFTSEMLGDGATQIRKANYARKGIYFQAFTSLSTGLERIGKLCLILDYYIDHKGIFPDSNYFKVLKNEIAHNITRIYQESAIIVAKHAVPFEFTQNLNGNIHRQILMVLSDFSGGDRYSNINSLSGSKQTKDPISSWFKQVDMPLYETRVTERRKQSIKNNAVNLSRIMGDFAFVLHVSETGTEINNFEDASALTGLYEAVAPYRQLYVLQIIRYWVELLIFLQYKAMQIGDDIPFFSEIFGGFRCDDSYIKKRKTWNSF